MSESFFEVRQQLAQQHLAARRPRKAAAGAGATTGDTGAGGGAVTALTVTQFTALIEKAIKSGVPATVTVRGEVSNTRDRQASGHVYFTLKDANACLNCVMWRDVAARLKFKLEDGAEMIATGKAAVYAAQGRYQLTVASLVPVGQGALELAFRQLRAKLEAEGLFAAERKKPLPRFPARIVMVTSQATAALQDILKVLRRFSWLKLMLYHVPVQGEGAGEKIARALDHLNARANTIGGVDVILLARGGGSLEDLWAFNEECVARSVAASKIPIVTGIGHEIDISIADLIADHHAHTPTEAAAVVTQHWKKAADLLVYSQTRLRVHLRQIAQEARQRLNAMQRHEFFRRPMDRIQILRQMLDDRQRALTMATSNRITRVNRRLAQADARLRECHPRHQITLAAQKLASLQGRLGTAMKGSLNIQQAKMETFHRQLEALSPQAVLNRGYSITTLKKTNAVIRDAASVKPGDRLLTRFRDGQTESVVADTKQLSLFE